MITITTKQSLLRDETHIAHSLAMAMSLCTDATREYVGDGKVKYSFQDVPAGLFTNDEFSQILQSVDFEIEGLVLYLPVQSSLLDTPVPESFTGGTINEVVDEDGKVLQEQRQATWHEYFPRSVKVDDVAVIETWGRNVNTDLSIPNKVALLTQDIPNRLELLNIIGNATPYLVEEILTFEGKGKYIAELQEIE